MPPINYAQLYLQALQQKFAQGLMFNELYQTPNNATIRWVNAKTIQIPNITTGGFVDVDRDVVSGYTRRFDNQWIPKTLEHDREFSTLADPMDVDETNMATTIANITRVFNDENKIPEMDKYMASKLYAEYTDFGQTAVTTEITEANALGIFDDMMEEMDEAEVPQEGRILYVTPAIKKILKNAEKIQRTLEVKGEASNVNRNVRSLDEVTIKAVPSSRMKTLYDFTDGAVPDESGGQINMLLIHPLSVIAPQKYEFVSLDEPSAKTGGKYLYYERKYWDAFLIEPKVKGVKFHITPAAE
ncbi:capsid protein [Evansella tamaricis]|uniref:Capsid protein n=1 Tax=Evansella tamaricis TaxID=2069301 RepID=A0ABS6JFF8_9BACI|nr:capsid protein [Evansella tamaricis]MBU9711068.1 capsid protein [Evansella tamaricis]